MTMERTLTAKFKFKGMQKGSYKQKRGVEVRVTHACYTCYKMTNSKIFKEIVSLLYWTMLAACTVGPGTVVTCARAGAEFDLNLIWALIFASILSYTLQEGVKIIF